MLPDPRDYEVHDEQIEEALRDLARLIDRRIPDGMGFALLLFDFKDPPEAMFYISNAERGSMVKATQEFVRKQKERGY